MNAIVRILITRDGMLYDEAMSLVQEAKDMVHDGADPEEVLYNEFGLEPDYIFDLLD